MSVDRPRPCPPFLPSMSGLAAYSLASLLFWFNKTKSGGLGGRDGGAAMSHPNHHPQVPPRAKLILELPGSALAVSVLPTALSRPQPFSGFLTSGGTRESGHQTEWLVPKGLFCPSLPILFAESRNPDLPPSGQGPRSPDPAGPCPRNAPVRKAEEVRLCLAPVPASLLLHSPLLPVPVFPLSPHPTFYPSLFPSIATL